MAFYSKDYPKIRNILDYLRIKAAKYQRKTIHYKKLMIEDQNEIPQIEKRNLVCQQNFLQK